MSSMLHEPHPPVRAMLGHRAALQQRPTLPVLAQHVPRRSPHGVIPTESALLTQPVHSSAAHPSGQAVWDNGVLSAALRDHGPIWPKMVVPQLLKLFPPVPLQLFIPMATQAL